VPTKEEKYQRWLEHEPTPVSSGDTPQYRFALILAPFYSLPVPVPGSGTSGPVLYYETFTEDLTAISSSLTAIGYAVSGPYIDTRVTVDRLFELLNQSWGVIYFRTHGSLLPDGDYILATAQRIPEKECASPASRKAYLNGYLNKTFGRGVADRLRNHVIAGVIEGGAFFIAIRSGFFRETEGDYSSSLVFINACESTKSDRLITAIAPRAFVGWRVAVDRELGGDVSPPFFRCLTKKTRTAREAMDFSKNYLLDVKGYEHKIAWGSSYDPNFLDVYRRGKSKPEDTFSGIQRRMMMTVRDWAIRQRLSGERDEDLRGLCDRLAECTEEDLTAVDKAMAFPTFCGEAFAFEIPPADVIEEVRRELCGYRGAEARFTLIEE
jgi:hypothetical protein